MPASCSGPLSSNRCGHDSHSWLALSNTPALPTAPPCLTDGAEHDFSSGASLLVSSRLCSEVLYKELYLPPFELQRERAGRVLLGRRLPLPIHVGRVGGRPPWCLAGRCCVAVLCLYSTMVACPIYATHSTPPLPTPRCPQA